MKGKQNITVNSTLAAGMKPIPFGILPPVPKGYVELTGMQIPCISGPLGNNGRLLGQEYRRPNLPRCLRKQRYVVVC